MPSTTPEKFRTRSEGSINRPTEPIIAALAYARLGWKVFPCTWIADEGCSCRKEDCDSPGKHPRIQGGLTNASADADQIRGWWSKWPDANIGIVAGAASGFFVIDIDAHHGGEESWYELRAMRELPHSVQAITGGGGQHLLFKYPDRKVWTRTEAFGEKYPGLDVRGDGGYIIVYPSNHRSGGIYYWEASGDPLDDAQLDEAPQWLLDLVCGDKPKREPVVKPVASGSPPLGPPPAPPERGPVDRRLDEEDGPIPEGRRDETLFKIAASLRGKGHDFYQIYGQLTEINNTRCKPPVSDAQVKKCARSASALEANSVPRAERPLQTSARRHDWQEGIDARVTYSPVPAGNYEDPETGEVRAFRDKDVGNAERFIAWFGADLRYVAATGWHVYENGRWLKGPEGELAARRVAMSVCDKVLQLAVEAPADERKFLTGLALSLQTKRAIDNMVSLGKSFPQIQARLEDFDRDPLLLGTMNGTLDLRTGELRNASPADMITMRTSCRYEQQDCPLFLKFFSEIMLGKEDLMQFVMLSLGYSLSGLMTPATFWFLIGTGANGKSILTGLVQRILGDYSTTLMPDSIMVRRNEQIPADIAKLQGKRMVVVPEVDDGRTLNLPLLKALSSSEEKITARFLNANYVDFYSTAKLWLTGNQKPQVKTFDSALRRRLRVVPFELQLTEEQKDEELGEKLQAEAAGVLWLMAAAFREFQNKRKLPMVDAVEAATDEYRRETDIVGQFLEEETEPQEEILGRLKKTLLRERYVTWCKTNGIVPDKRNTFYDKVRAHGVTVGSTKTDGDFPFVGIRLRTGETYE